MRNIKLLQNAWDEVSGYFRGLTHISKDQSLSSTLPLMPNLQIPGLFK